MERFHRGISAPGSFKGREQGISLVARARGVPKHGGTVHPIVTDALARLAGGQNITPHVWTRAWISSSDICVFDRSADDAESGVLRSVVLALRDLLGELGLASWVKTTGSKASTLPCRWTVRRIITAAHFADAAGTLLARRDPKPHPGVPQGGSRRPDLVDTGLQQLQRDVCGRVRPCARGRPRRSPPVRGEIGRGESNRRRSRCGRCARRRSPPPAS